MLVLRLHFNILKTPDAGKVKVKGKVVPVL
jgi:hypothetical protein